MNSILLWFRFPVFRRGLLQFAMVLLAGLAPSLIGRPVEGVTRESGRTDVMAPTNASLRVAPNVANPPQSCSDFAINTSVIAGDGGAITNGNTRLDGTIGQSVLGASSAGSFSLLSGSWQTAQQPNVANSISGTISYCIDPTKKIQGATVATTSGSPSGMGNTDTLGFYQIDNLGAGPYAIAPTKTGGVNGISAFDAALVAQFVANFNTPTSCQILAGDVSNNGSLSAFDAGLIAQTVANIPNGGIAGTWKFVPSSRNYITLPASLTNESYDAVLVGDVSGNWTPAGPTIASSQAPAVNVSVSLPDASSAPGTANFMLPVFVGNTTGQGIIAFDFTFTFMTSVLQIANPAFETAGTLSAGWNITPVTSTPGQVRIIAFNATPLSGSGKLIFLKFNVVGAQNAMTQLNWTSFVFNEGAPAASPLTNGQFTATGPTAVTLGKFEANGYENGVHLKWSTGFEAANLGFNVYRDVDGQRTLVNPEIIGGSALMARTATKLQAGQSYGWWDNAGAKQRRALYWLEEIDLNGLRTMHGPFAVRQVGGSPPRESQAELLSRLGRGEPTVHQTPLNHEFSRSDSLHAEVSTLDAAPELSALPALKLTIREEGWYRITQQELAATGFDARTNPRNLRLYVEGTEQSMLVAGEQDGRLDSIEFFAMGQDTAATDAHVYWLVRGDTPGKRISVVNSEGKSAGGASFPYTVERRDRTIYFSGLRNGETENFFGQVITSRPVDQTVTIRHLDVTSSNQPELEVALQGVTDHFGGAPDHSVKVLMNGLQIGRLVFDGRDRKVQTFTIGRELLKEGDNVVTFTAELADNDISLVDCVRVTYPHAYTSDQESLRMSVASGSQTIDGFNNRNVRVVDITDPSTVTELIGKASYQGDSYSVTVDIPGQGTRTLLAFTDDRVKSPASITINEPSNLRTKKHKADMLIITRRQFFGAIEPLKRLRESQGLRVEMVDVDDVFDEFSDGEKTPQAVRDFLRFAATRWKKKPRFVLFAGHASLDPRNYLGFGDSDIAPTKLVDTLLMETASDDWFVDFNDDGLPELAIGRLPFRTADEAATMVSKILSYERARPANEALLVADANDGFDFEEATGLVRNVLPASLKVTEIDRGGVDAASAKKVLIDSINRGQTLVNYIGHGSVNQWKGDLLTNDDATALTNGNRLSLFVMMTCLNGYFQDAALDSLAEALLKAERGGAVAVWASSGMTSPSEQSRINLELLRSLFGADVVKGRALTLGEAVMRAKSATDDADVRRTWMLLGDPAMRIR